MRTLLHDLRFGLRIFLASPALSIVAVLTLALGISANTTVFSWIDGLLLHPYPGARDSRGLAVLEMSADGAPNGANQTSWLDYLDYRSGLGSLSGLALHREEVFSLGDSAAAVQPVWGEFVSGNYFDVLGVVPATGRVFSPAEGASSLGAHPVAVISHRLWQGRFQGDPHITGRTLTVNRTRLTVVGVAPPEFRGTMPGLAFDIWVPATMGKDLGLLSEQTFRDRGNRAFYAVARLRDGVARAQASAEANAMSRRLAKAYPKSNRGVQAAVLPVWEFHSAAPDLLLRPLRILMAIAILVLLIGCVNVANLLMARSVSRHKELSIRLALGAKGSRLARQLVTEALLISSMGALLGWILSFWMADSLPALIPRINAPIALGFQVSGRVVAFTALVCMLSAVLSSAAPALFWLRSNVNDALKAGGRSGSQGVQSHRSRAALVVAEVALATVALVAAGVFVRSFYNATRINPGFDPANVAMARFYLGGARYSSVEMQQFADRLSERLKGTAGVMDVSYANYAPLGSGSGPYTGVRVEGDESAQNEPINVNNYLVAPGFFQTLRIPLLEGRDFTSGDDASSAPVLIVNESFARRYFHGASPLGRKVRFFGRWATVVGLAKDSKYFNVAEAPRPHFFAPYRQQARPGTQLYVFLRTAAPTPLIAAGLRREVTAIDPQATAYDLMPLLEWTSVTLLPQKVAANLLAVLGIMSLILAAVGLYSVIAYSVSQRVREIGVRMALGAMPRNVLGGVIRQGMTLTAIGLVIGIAVTIPVGRLVASMLVDAKATDLSIFAAAAVFLAATALLASYLPALRATRVDPVIVLRCD